MRAISLPAAQLFATNEGLYSIELILLAYFPYLKKIKEGL
jgi:hypothetical protein